MRNFDNLPRFDTVERAVKILQDRTGTKNQQFFRAILNYYMGVVSSMMRTTIHTLDRGVLPTNNYTINLAPSGFG